MRMDETDEKILELIRYNARMSYQEIADNVELSRVAVKKRVQKLEEAGIIRQYGEERYARRIAGRICTQRQKKPIETTGELAEIIKPIHRLGFWKNGTVKGKINDRICF